MPSARLFLLTVLAGATLWTAACSVVNQAPDNEPPVVQVRDADTTSVARGGRVQLSVSASDEDDDPLSYVWSSGGAGSFGDSLSSSTFWTAPNRIVGPWELFLLSVTIIDNQPDTQDPVETFLIEVRQTPPQLQAPADTSISFREPGPVLKVWATDAESDAITFDWQIVPQDGGLTADRVQLGTQTRKDTSTVRVLALEPGQVHLQVSATDGQDTVQADVVVSVTEPAMPDGGTVSLQLPEGRSFDIDVYEYPNQRGAEPLLVDGWFEAHELCGARGMRLCTTQEWIYACSGPDSLSFSSLDERGALPSSFGLRFCNERGSDLWGEDPDNDEARAPSGSFPNCSSGTGVFDLTGNTAEWLHDWVPSNGDTTVTAGHRALYSRSSATGEGRECDLVRTLGLIPLAGDEPGSPSQAFVDSVLSAPYDAAFVEAARTSSDFSGYFTEAGSRRGFRCCR